MSFEDMEDREMRERFEYSEAQLNRFEFTREEDAETPANRRENLKISARRKL